MSYKGLQLILRLIAWGRIYLKKLKTTEKNFPAFYESRDFITVLTTVYQLTMHQDQSSPHAQTQ
jgi:hypothetical protein